MRVLIACEESGVVREAFRKRGHDAWSCDLIESRMPGAHIIGDVLGVLDQSWDLLIGFPPCDHLCVSGAHLFAAKRADGRQQRGETFFMALANAPIAKIAIENPVGIMSTKWRKPNQIIQPFQFGHAESKKTCLWLKGLPKLVPTKVLELPDCGHWENQTPSGQNRLGPSATRKRDRAKTYQGIADAMAEQWG